MLAQEELLSYTLVVLSRYMVLHIFIHIDPMKPMFAFVQAMLSFGIQVSRVLWFLHAGFVPQFG